MTGTSGHYGDKVRARNYGVWIIAIVVGITLFWMVGLIVELVATAVGNVFQVSLPLIAISRVVAIVVAVAVSRWIILRFKKFGYECDKCGVSTDPGRRICRRCGRVKEFQLDDPAH